MRDSIRYAAARAAPAEKKTKCERLSIHTRTTYAYLYIYIYIYVYIMYKKEQTAKNKQGAFMRAIEHFYRFLSLSLVLSLGALYVQRACARAALIASFLFFFVSNGHTQCNDKRRYLHIYSVTFLSGTRARAHNARYYNRCSGKSRHSRWRVAIDESAFTAACVYFQSGYLFFRLRFFFFLFLERIRCGSDIDAHVVLTIKKINMMRISRAIVCFTGCFVCSFRDNSLNL